MNSLGNMKKIDLFSTPIWVSQIPGESYNKQELIDAITVNYSKNSNRNKYSDFISDMHNYYGDWDNTEYLPLDMVKLNSIYGILIEQFMQQQLFATKTEYMYNIVNVSVSKSGQSIHLHGHDDCSFVSAHYISLDPEHKSTIFENPTMFGYYSNNKYELKSLFNSENIENSIYYGTYSINSKEDDFVIFPSYLKHLVLNESKVDKLRITTSCNIYLKEAQ